MNGHIRCIRLVVADFVLMVPYQSICARLDADNDGESNVRGKNEEIALSKFVNKTPDDGITALHMASLNGYFGCVKLLLDLDADMSCVTFHHGTSIDLKGRSGGSPLHYVACGGNLKCCQVQRSYTSSDAVTPAFSLNCC
ncbi:unnamed protein product [Lathyrus sativus]|nr:unnamed protein product [Lathyrus sativus]